MTHIRPRASLAPLLMAPLLLAGCTGFRTFLDNTHGTAAHVNAPVGNSEAMRTVNGVRGTSEQLPLPADSGNIWPGALPKIATLEDLQRTAPPTLEGVTAPPLANLPGLSIPTIPHHLQPRPGEDGTVLNGPLASPGAAITLPRDTGVLPRALPPSRVPVSPGSTVVPNGDGTSTVIAPNGTITTIPTPKQPSDVPVPAPNPP